MTVPIAIAAGIAVCYTGAIIYSTIRTRPSTITAGGVDLADHNDILKAILDAVRLHRRLDDIILIDIAEQTGQSIGQVFAVADEVRDEVRRRLQQR